MIILGRYILFHYGLGLSRHFKMKHFTRVSYSKQKNIHRLQIDKNQKSFLHDSYDSGSTLL